MSICQSRLTQIQKMIAAGTSDDFYDWTEWLYTRSKVLRLDNQECQACKKNHRYQKAVIVHHIKHLKERPDLALSVFDPDTGRRQLVSLCRACHEKEHPERWRRETGDEKPLLTKERWD